MKNLLTATLLLWCKVLLAQAPDYPPAPPAVPNLVKAEYFFDSDPGFGNGNNITLSPVTDISNLTANIVLNGSALNKGFHRLYIRTQDANGRWSHPHNALFVNFLVPDYPAAPGAAPNLAEAEYFIDTDPGVGLATKISLPAATDASSVTVLVNVGGLSTGVHRLYIRTKDANGRWSHIYYGVFENALQTPYPTAPAPAPALSQAEYYFDTDPGFGNGTPISLPASTDVADFSFNVPVGSLTQGRHIIYLRSRQNPWSMSAYAEFTIGSTLPVSFLYAKAEVTGRDVLVSWATGFEQNANRFEVEYSTNGHSFNAVGSVKATNNSSGSSYRFRHVQVPAGAAYYRIRQVDNDGKATYSKIMLLVTGQNESQPMLFPNPVRDVVNVTWPASTSVARIVLLSADGRQIKVVTISKDQRAAIVPVTELKSGNYFLRLDAGSNSITMPFVKQ